LQGGEGLGAMWGAEKAREYLENGLALGIDESYIFDENIKI
jgi:hypothetical protein